MAVDILNPSPEHLAMRKTLREFAEREVEPQAREHDRSERLNLPRELYSHEIRRRAAAPP